MLQVSDTIKTMHQEGVPMVEGSTKRLKKRHNIRISDASKNGSIPVLRRLKEKVNKSRDLLENWDLS